MDITILITASFCKFHPSLIIMASALHSLQYLQLRTGTDVLLVHDRPPRQEKKFDLYINKLNASMPSIRKCMPNINPQLIIADTHLHQAKALAFGLSFVKTHFFLKMEHDHIFIRRVFIYNILKDMSRDSALKIVRFNRRRNMRVNCDDGYYEEVWKKKLARHLWKEHTVESDKYTRTVCFSDMNHISRVDFYSNMIISPAVKAAPQMIETTIQKLIIYNHSLFGTYIYGGPYSKETLTHLDASKHGHGELDRVHIAKIQTKPVYEVRCTATVLR